MLKDRWESRKGIFIEYLWNNFKIEDLTKWIQLHVLWICNALQYFVLLSDILGDGSVKPSDLITGPPWLIGFKGNEMQRLSRQMKFQGKELAYLYPTRFHRLKKRIKFLYKRYNQRRSKRY